MSTRVPVNRTKSGAEMMPTHRQIVPAPLTPAQAPANQHQRLAAVSPQPGGVLPVIQPRLQVGSAYGAHQEPPHPNRTGLPDELKAGVEELAGLSLDDVRVHYNSSRPAQLQALAYARGTEIHVAPGQERHLPHEAWHVVQQAQRRVQPTIQISNGVPINDDEGLEHEADIRGGEAISEGGKLKSSRRLVSLGATTSIGPEPADFVPHPFSGSGQLQGVAGFRGSNRSGAAVTSGVIQTYPLYRGMQASAPNGPNPLLGNVSGFQLGVRATEVTVDHNGWVQPGGGGMSTSNAIHGVPDFTVSQQYIGGAHGTVNQASQPYRWKWTIETNNLPATVQARNDHGNHELLEPAPGQQLTLAMFQGIIQGTQGNWQRIPPP